MKMVHRVFLIATSIVCTLSMSLATTYYVNASTGNDANNGTASGTAFKTITHALSIATNGDVINVAAGTYNTALGETFPLMMVSGVTLTGTAGALTTIIDATGSLNRVFDCNANSSSTIIQGFTIKGGSFTASTNGSNSVGGGISFTNGDQTVLQNNIITKDTARGYHFNEVSGGHNGGNSYGGGIYVASASPTIRNNVISYCVAIGGGGENWQGGFSGTPAGGGFATGGGIAAAFANSMTVINNTFYGNKAVGGPGGATNQGSEPTASGGNAASGALDAGFNVTARNNIFVNNSAVGGTIGGGGSGGGSAGSETDGAITAGTAGQVSFNLYFGNTATTNPDGGQLGSSNVMLDPQFVSTTDFHLTSTSSPAFQTGTPTGAPAADLEGTSRGGAPSIGAYQGLDPLPVELVSFVATPRGSAVELDWTTATEVNNCGFEIERREFNSQLTIRNPQYTKVGFVAGAGTSSSPREYIFADRGIPAGRYAYRIKQIDKDGSFKYTGEAEVEVGLAPTTLTLGENYPNPFNPSTTIEFSVPQNGRAVLKVIDLLGREVATLFEGEAKSGYYQRVVFDATRLASGVYFSRLEFGGKQQMKKMLMLK